MASMPKRKVTPSASHASSCLVWVKSVSPRREIRRNPAPRQSRIARSSCSAAPSCEGRLPGRLTMLSTSAGVGQRDDQRVVAPGAVVGDIDALLAARAGGHERAVDIEHGLGEEVGRLRLPDLDPRPIEDVLEGLDVVGGEAAAEVAGGGGVGDAVGAEGVEEDGVVAPQLDVVEAGAIAEGVVGEVQDVVTLVVREVVLEQVESFVDGLGEPEFPYQELHGPDPAGGDGAGLLGDVIMDVRRGEDRLWRGAVIVRSSRWRIFRLPVAWCGVESASLEISLWVRSWDLCRSIQCAGNAGRFRFFRDRSSD